MNCPICGNGLERIEETDADGFCVSYRCAACLIRHTTAERARAAARALGIDPTDAVRVERAVYALLVALNGDRSKVPVVLGYLNSYRAAALAAVSAQPTQELRVAAVNAQRLQLLARLHELGGKDGAL